jgi:hypothetical protein
MDTLRDKVVEALHYAFWAKGGDALRLMERWNEGGIYAEEYFKKAYETLKESGDIQKLHDEVKAGAEL